MAFVLIEPDGERKGVLVFKHLELWCLQVMPPLLLSKLRERYIVGLYIGFSIVFDKDPDCVDFYIAANNVLSVLSGTKIPRLNLNGFNFIDSFIRSPVVEKKYDFLYVGNSFSRKNLLVLIKSLFVVLNADSDASFCIINRYARGVESFLYRRRVRRSLGKLSAEMRSKVTYIEVPPTSDPLPAYLVSQVLGASRALVIPSRSEGAARVVAEAVLNDLPIVYYSKMKGGTANHLDPNFDVPVSDLNNLGHVMLQSLDRVRRFSGGRGDADVYLEATSKVILKSFLHEHFAYSEIFLSEVIDSRKLYNAFSGHQNVLPERFSNRRTDEILIPSRMYMYLSYLCEMQENRWISRFYCWKFTAGRLMKLPLAFAKSVYKGFFM